MKTEKLYHYKTYDTEFCANVIAINKKNELYEVVLDKTLFYPEGGGQPYDTGKLKGFDVVNVQIKDDEVIHYIQGNIDFEIGDEVHGKIDWDRRYEHMQCHTAEHIVTGMARQYYPCENIGFNISDNLITIDLSVNLNSEQLKYLEEKCNQYIMKNVTVDINYPSSEELKSLEYRAKLELTENVRIVNVGDIDVCACCGLHCADVREIGLIKFISSKKNKGGTRIMCLAGRRALKDYGYKHNAFRELGDLLSAKEEAVLGRVKKLFDDYNELKSNEQLLKSKIYELELKDYNDSIYIKENLNNNELKNINLILQDKREVAYVLSDDGESIRYSIGSKEKDCREISKILNKEFNGRGGGRPELVQGSFFDSLENIVSYINNLNNI